MRGPDARGGTDVPAVSVVIPAHDAECTLAATLESVSSQTLRDFEVIVVDDGSTDATLEIARAFAARDPRIRVVSQANRGVADARNAGIERARAELVAALDADDLWHETFLEKLHAALSAAGPDVLFAFANFREIDLDGEVLGSAPLHEVEGRVFNRFLLRNFVGNGSGLMFRRQAALAVGGYERRLEHEFGAQGCEDWLLQLRLAARGEAVSVPEYLVGYRLVPGAMSSDPLRMWRSRIHAFEILFEETGAGDRRAARWGLGRARAHCMIHEMLAGEIRAGLRSLRAALVRDPLGTCEVLYEGAVLMLRRSGGRLLRSWLPLGTGTKGSFASLDPRDQRRPLRRSLLTWRLERMTELDARRRAAPEPIPSVAPLGDVSAETSS